jgi:FRG domain-containing protein
MEATDLNAQSPIRTVHCQTPKEFLQELSKLRGPLPRMWIFRGHSDDAYQLVPSALRNDSQPLTERSNYREVSDNKTQRFLEICELDEFFKTADSIGLALPEDTQVLRSYLFRARHESDMWPQEHVLSLMALAQHHGVPTRLLDWSRNPLKAALFAASVAIKNPDKTGRLSVWAFPLSVFELCPSENATGTLYVGDRSKRYKLKSPRPGRRIYSRADHHGRWVARGSEISRRSSC